MLSRGHRDFPLVFLASQYWKNSRVIPSTFRKISDIEFFLCLRTENHVLQSKFFVSEYEKKLWEPLLSFRMFGISKTFVAYHSFPSIFLSHSTENFVRNHLMLQKVSNVRYRKNLWIRTEYHDFPSEIFWLRVPNISLWNTSVYEKSSVIQKFHAYEVDITFLRWIFFNYTAYKIRWGTPLCFRIFRTSETFMPSRGHRDFPLVFLASQYWKISWVTLSTLREISGIETFYAWERKITFFCRNFFVSQYQKSSW